MVRKNLLFFCTIISLFLSTFTISVCKNSSASAPVENPYLTIHFSEDDLDYSILEQYKENFTAARITILEGFNEIVFHGSIFLESYNYYYFTDEQEQLLIQACSPNITTILDYIKENNFTADYNDFYSYDITGAYANLDWLDEYKKIDDNWYLAAHSFKPYTKPIFDDVTTPLTILTIISFVIGGFFGFKYNKSKKKRYLVGLTIGILLGVYFLLIIYLWLTALVAT